MTMNGRVAYLALQATREGQASYAHVHEIIDGLRDNAWSVELFEPYYARKEAEPSVLTKLWSFMSVQIQLWRRFNDIDVLYVRSHPVAFPTAIWAKIRRIPTVCEVNGPFEDLFVGFGWTRLFAPGFRAILRIPLMLADAIIVVTPQLRDWAQGEVGSKPLHVIRNGANTRLFSPNSPLPFSLPQQYVVFFGVLAVWQGVDCLLQATQSSNWPSAVSLVVVGDGRERTRVESVAANDAKVIYLGRIPYAQVPGIVANSIGGISPQNNAGGRSVTGLSPLKVYETLACGRPVIVTDFPGQAELVRESECGIVIPPDDPDALAQAVSYLYHHDIERNEMGRRGREAVEQSHSWSQRASDTSKVLAGLLDDLQS